MKERERKAKRRKPSSEKRDLIMNILENIYEDIITYASHYYPNEGQFWTTAKEQINDLECNNPLDEVFADLKVERIPQFIGEAKLTLNKIKEDNEASNFLAKYLEVEVH